MNFPEINFTSTRGARQEFKAASKNFTICVLLDLDETKKQEESIGSCKGGLCCFSKYS